MRTPRKIDAELLDDVATHLSDGHLEHHLISPPNRKAVYDLRFAADEPRSDVESMLRFGGAGCRSGKHHAVRSDTLDVNVGIRHRLLERRAHAIEVTRHGNIKSSDLLTVGIEKENARLPDRDTDHVDPPRRPDHRVGNLGIGNEHVLDIGGKVDCH